MTKRTRIIFALATVLLSSMPASAATTSGNIHWCPVTFPGTHFVYLLQPC